MRKKAKIVKRILKKTFDLLKVPHDMKKLLCEAGKYDRIKTTREINLLQYCNSFF
jgi:hypothetical protein